MRNPTMILRWTLLVCSLLLVGSAGGIGTSNNATPEKSDSHVLTNPAYDSRQGGETIDNAVPIPSLPFHDTGATCDNIDDYDETCPYEDSTSPDVVYSITTTANTFIDVDLCYSGYDTKVYVYDTNFNVIACNDDYYYGSPCGVYTSYLEGVTLSAGQLYYIVVDGYAGDCGDYDLWVTETDIWLKMDPPPDVDKFAHGHVGTGTCWMATAANMLAGAGYGIGSTVQQRADSIYNQMVANFGLGGGWTDAAVSWWLGSVHNTWPANPYTVVTVYGNKVPKYPWANSNGARFIANELRRCQFLGLSISWPTTNGSVGTGGHAITGWGDDGDAGQQTTNPAIVAVTDSDRDIGGDLQLYLYDDYNNPNPGGPNEGNGWYTDYSNNHPYIKHIVTLCPTDNPGDNVNTQKVVGSMQIHQDADLDATDLHYRVGTDVDILSYRTWIDWETGNPPQIIEVGNPPRELDVTWDLTDNPVPYCTWITITTEFVLPNWNAISYNDVYFTYPDTGIFKPGFSWELITPEIPDPDFENITGGYVIGSFDLYRVNQNQEGRQQEMVARHRLLHQYSYFQEPEFHEVLMSTAEGDTEWYTLRNMTFGHSYGMLPDTLLWEFEEWLSEVPEMEIGPGVGVEIPLDWDGQLPYPPGESYVAMDFDHDLDVDMVDFEVFASCYAGPGEPVGPGCYWADFDLDEDVDCDDWGLFVTGWTGPPVEPPIFVPCEPSAVPETPDQRQGLLKNVPNPFNPSTEIEFAVGRSQQVQIAVYSLGGRKLAVLTDQVYPEGNHSVFWDGTDSAGKNLASGVYLIRMQMEAMTDSRKLTLVR